MWVRVALGPVGLGSWPLPVDGLAPIGVMLAIVAATVAVAVVGERRR